MPEHKNNGLYLRILYSNDSPFWLAFINWLYDIIDIYLFDQYKKSE